MKIHSNKILLTLAAFAVVMFSVNRADAGAFFNTSEMTTPRSGQTATLLTNGLVLIAGGQNSSTFQPTAGAELYDPSTGAWTATGLMRSPRYNHTATLLPNGKVLIAGGTGTNFAAPYFGTLPTAELYDPANGQWTSVNDMNVARKLHTASLLKDGKVLVAGGAYDSSPAAEIFDPITGAWTATAPMTTNRKEHTATALANGMVLVAGGTVQIGIFNSEPTATAELYNPANGSWTATGSMTTNRTGHEAVLLQNGKVLVVENQNSNATPDGNANAEIFDPLSGTWMVTGSMNAARDNATATLLNDGQVLVAGGDDGYPSPFAELYNPTTGKWVVAGSMISIRSSHTATLLPNGQVLISGGGGFGSTSAELYNPGTAWAATGSLNIGRISGYTLTVLTNGEVLLAGGGGYTGVEASAELFNPMNGSWTPTGNMTTPRKFHTATLLANGKVLVTGGKNEGALSSVELYDPATGIWTAANSMTASREHHTATLLNNGNVLVAGGGTTISSAELFDPATGNWSATDLMDAARWHHTATLLSNGKVLVAGGINNSGGIANAELYDPSLRTWSQTGVMNVPRAEPVATLLSNGNVFVAGGYGAIFAEIYNPASGEWSVVTAATAGRQYFSATLLANGKVLIAGGSVGGTNESPSAELFDSTIGTWTNTYGPMTSGRSQQQAVLLGDGRVLVVGGDVDFTGVHLGITTELFNPNAGTTPQIVLVPSAIFSGGSFQFDFTASPGESYTVRSTTNISRPFSSWTSLGPVTEMSAGHFHFSNSQAVSLKQRFYRVISP
jgi:hypothetical protein